MPLEKFHDVTRFCGQPHKDLALDQVHYDAGRKALVATDGVVTLIAPIGMGAESDTYPAATVQAAIDYGELPYNPAGQGLPFPNVGADASQYLPRQVVRLDVARLRSILDYAAAHGFATLAVMVGDPPQAIGSEPHCGAPQTREVVDPLRFALEGDGERQPNTAYGLIYPVLTSDPAGVDADAKKAVGIIAGDWLPASNGYSEIPTNKFPAAANNGHAAQQNGKNGKHSGHAGLAERVALRNYSGPRRANYHTSPEFAEARRLAGVKANESRRRNAAERKASEPN